MQFFGSKVPGRTYLLVFDRGELLLEGIQEMVRKEGIESAVITGGIGSLTELKCHAIAGTGLPATDAPMHAVGPIELSSVQGSVVGGDPHVHVVAWNYDNKETYVGHLEPGSRVCFRAEVSMQMLEGVQFDRYSDKETGMIWIREAGEEGPKEA